MKRQQMKATPQTRATILWNLEHNVQQAKSKKARQFAQERLDLYKASIERENRPAFNNPLERFAQSLA
jgi:hypothetical protein